MTEDDQSSVELLKQNALDSYGDNRIDAIETLATFGEDALPALAEIANKSTNVEPQKVAREKIRDINANE